MNLDYPQRGQFKAFIQAIVSGDVSAVETMLRASPHLAKERAAYGAARQVARESYYKEILHYMCEGDTALHMAAAAYQERIAVELIASGAYVRARNRRGAEPIHYACDGVPGPCAWSPRAQAATIACLIAAGADPDVVDKSGVAPVHRAVRTRCTAAANALLDGGANARAANGRGSTPLSLAMQNTGRVAPGQSRQRRSRQKYCAYSKCHLIESHDEADRLIVGFDAFRASGYEQARHALQARSRAAILRLTVLGQRIHSVT